MGYHCFKEHFQKKRDGQSSRDALYNMIATCGCLSIVVKMK